jgi:hypothetical protein
MPIENLSRHYNIRGGIFHVNFHLCLVHMVTSEGFFLRTNTHHDTCSLGKGAITMYSTRGGGLFLYFWVQTYRSDFQNTPPIHIFNIFENHTHSYIFPLKILTQSYIS